MILCSLPRPLTWPPLFPLEKGLVLWLPFDERSGSKALDRSGKLNHGTLYGSTWTAGKRGSALSFDGVDDRIEVPDNTGILDDIAAISIEFWVYLNTLKNYEVFISKNSWNCYICHTDLLGILYWGVNGSAVRINKAAGFIIEAWYHYVLVSTGTQLLVYRNGVLLDSVNKITAVPDTAGDLHIGADHDDTNVVDGIIDEVRIYNRALTAEEAKRHYNSELLLGRRMG